MVLFAKVVLSTLALLPFFVFIEKRLGQHWVQVYLSCPGDKEGPSHTLRAFKRVHIAKGQRANVSFTLDNETFQWFDTNTNTMRMVEGNYELLYGGTSRIDQLQKISISVTD